MRTMNRGLMQALRQYTPEYKQELLSRTTYTWRSQQKDGIKPHEESESSELKTGTDCSDGKAE